MRRQVGWALVLGLWLSSLAASFLFPGLLRDHCPFGADVLRPDETVCTLSFGGLWVSLSLGLAAALGATGLGLLVALVARLLRGPGEAVLIRVADASFSLPDVLLLMVLQASAQTLGDVHPEWRLPPWLLMVGSLTLVGWAAPARILRDSLERLERQEFVAASRALGASRLQLYTRHLLPGVKGTLGALFLLRLPAAILAESTVSFFGIARMEPLSLGRYLGTGFGALATEGGLRVVGPAWALLVLVVFGAALAGGQAGRPSRG